MYPRSTYSKYCIVVKFFFLTLYRSHSPLTICNAYVWLVCIETIQMLIAFSIYLIKSIEELFTNSIEIFDTIVTMSQVNNSISVLTHAILIGVDFPILAPQFFHSDNIHTLNWISFVENCIYIFQKSFSSKDTRKDC